MSTVNREISASEPGGGMWVASLEPFVQPFMSVVQAKLKGLGFVCKHSHKHGSFSQKQWNLLPVSVNLFPKKSYGSF